MASKKNYLLSQILLWHFFHDLRWITAEGVVPERAIKTEDHELLSKKKKLENLYD